MLLALLLFAIALRLSNNQTYTKDSDIQQCEKKNRAISVLDLEWNPKDLKKACFDVQIVDKMEIYWNMSLTSTKYAAIPHCIADSDLFMYRECTNNEFTSNVKCSTVQIETYCPSSLSFFNDKCLLLLENVPYEDVGCPYYYTINFDDYKLFFDNQKIWVPVKRDLDYGVGEMLVQEFSSRYGEPFDSPINFEIDELESSHCLSFRQDAYKAERCDSLANKICLYEHSKKFKPNFCSSIQENCFNVDFDTSNAICYCMSDDICNFVELQEFYQEQILRHKCKYGCKLDLEFVDNKLRWGRSKNYLTYTGWGYDDKVLEIQNNQVILEESGWKIEETSKSFPNLCKEDYKFVAPSIDFIHQGNTFTIQVENSVHFAKTLEGIYLFCFTDSSPDHLRSQICTLKNADESGKIVIKESGYYWCEGFANHNFMKISSKRYYAAVEEVYAITITFSLQAGLDPTSSNVAYGFIYALEKLYNDQSPKELKLKLKWAKTEHFNITSKTATYLVHVCGPNKESSLKSFLEIEEKLINAQPSSATLGQLKSLDFCRSCNSTFNNMNYTWEMAQVGAYAASNVPCLNEAGGIVKRLCKEDYLNGAYFEEINFCLQSNSSNNTQDLNDILNSNNSTSDLVARLIEITENVESFEPIDMFLMSSILEKFLYKTTNFTNIATVLSNIINAQSGTSDESQKQFNATDRILYSFDLLLQQQAESCDDLEIEETNLMVKIFTGLHGFMFKENKEIVEIREEMSLKSFSKVPHLQAAVYIPNVKTKASVSVFLKDTLFNDDKSKNAASNFGVLLLEDVEKIYLIFRPSDGLGTYRHSCGFWNYGTEKKGEWKLESRPRYLGVLQVCEFTHVTHFGLLIIDKDFIEDSGILSVISNIETALSLIGILGIFVTGALFKTWRENLGNTILIHYAAVSLAQIALLYISEKVLGAESWICILIGSLLHYTVLSQFCWMLVIGYLQYKRYIRVFKGKSGWLLIKACFVSYGIPAFPVMILFGFFSDTYVDGRVGLCYPTGNGLVLGVLLPVGLIVAVNVLIFSRIIFELFCKPKINSCVEDDVLLFRLRLVLLMFFMLGITWVFGFAAQIFESDFFIYLFLITSSIQGFMIFVFFIVCNENARKMYVYLWNKYTCR